MADVIKIAAGDENEAELVRARDTVLAGGVLATPTDTVYGLCGDATDERLIRRIYAIKGRDYTKPLSIFLASPSDVVGWAQVVSQKAGQLMDAFWPGALTIILPASEQVHPALVGGGCSLGIRIPNNPFLLELLKRCRRPLTATSANASGRPDPLSAEDTVAEIGHLVDLVVDGGRSPSPVTSTVIDLTVDPPLVRREGGVAVSEIEKLIGKVAIDD